MFEVIYAAKASEMVSFSGNNSNGMKAEEEIL